MEAGLSRGEEGGVGPTTLPRPLTAALLFFYFYARIV